MKAEGCALLLLVLFYALCFVLGLAVPVLIAAGVLHYLFGWF